LFAGLSVTFTWIYIPDKTKSEKKITSSEIKFTEFLRLFLNWRSCLFLLEMTIMGMAMALVERLLFVYVMEDPAEGGLGGNALLCGYTVGVTVIFEIPIFHNAKKLLKWPGRDCLYLISMFCYVIRVYGYTLLTHDTRYYLLGLEWLHGFTYACMWISSIDYSREVAPEGWITSTQMLVTGSYSMLGTSLGSLIGGYEMQLYGFRTVYYHAAIFLAIIFLLHMITAISLRKFTTKSGLFNKNKKK